jgi:hypothetical protein
MTHEELEQYLTPIVTNSSLTPEQKSSLLADVAQQWIREHPLHDPDDLEDETSLLQIFNEWNLVMATIVDKYNLRKH